MAVGRGFLHPLLEQRQQPGRVHVHAHVNFRNLVPLPEAPALSTSAALSVNSAEGVGHGLSGAAARGLDEHRQPLDAKQAWVNRIRDRRGVVHGDAVYPVAVSIRLQVDGNNTREEGSQRRERICSDLSGLQ